MGTTEFGRVYPSVRLSSGTLLTGHAARFFCMYVCHMLNLLLSELGLWLFKTVNCIHLSSTYINVHKLSETLKRGVMWDIQLEKHAQILGNAR